MGREIGYGFTNAQRQELRDRYPDNSCIQPTPLDDLIRIWRFPLQHYGISAVALWLLPIEGHRPLIYKILFSSVAKMRQPFGP